ncbi:MerR family DNA-binding transcriptional regulator [Nonomuraea turcica]|uniref:MerR family DNA-binding transcriptional regulator n=1 Tax=Nonomuraea sp. G32 TaxID=3067274 RepID=UPI00273BF329|nr:MerR family DNA-binding transcriptional regulator [Nonomuraea sp. G32]MDP4504900.1 MerR family DNA-binding transcriptional regulator [Nonomuraea sp. G32]
MIGLIRPSRTLEEITAIRFRAGAEVVDGLLGCCVCVVTAITLRVKHMLKSNRIGHNVESMTLTTPRPAPPLAVPAGEVFTVSDVAAESGVAPSAVRFYEKYGVITAVRTSGNQRRFDESAACRIQIAKLAQRVGLTVREIADLFADLPANPELDDWGRIADQLIAEAEGRVAQLKAYLAEIETGNKLCDIGANLDT